MKKLLLIIVFLTGCTSMMPVKQKFPEVPQELMVDCVDLKETEPTVKLSDVVKDVANNYGKYHECRIKAEVWTEWYKTQKQIFEGGK